jgi:hypothetical protein
MEMTMEQISFLSHLNTFTGQTLKDTFYEAVRLKFAAGISGQSVPRGQSVPQGGQSVPQSGQSVPWKPTGSGMFGQYTGYPSPNVGFSRPQVGYVSPQSQSSQHALMLGSYTGASNEAPTLPIYGGQTEIGQMLFRGMMPNQAQRNAQMNSLQRAYPNGPHEQISHTTGIFQFGGNAAQPSVATATANTLGGFGLRQLGVTQEMEMNQSLGMMDTSQQGSYQFGGASPSQRPNGPTIQPDLSNPMGGCSGGCGPHGGGPPHGGGGGPPGGPPSGNHGNGNGFGGAPGGGFGGFNPGGGPPLGGGGGPPGGPPGGGPPFPPQPPMSDGRMC